LVRETFQYANCRIARLIAIVAIEVTGNEILSKSAFVNDGGRKDGLA
jgi:hypothetical protein